MSDAELRKALEEVIASISDEDDDFEEAVQTAERALRW